VAAMPDPCDSRGNSVGNKKGKTNDDNDDDAMVVEAPAKILVPIHMAAAGLKTTGDDELQMMGYANPVLLPHLRPYCTEQQTAFCPLSGFTFTNEARTIPPWAMMGYDTNADICDFCYCYVCDKPAKDCQVRVHIGIWWSMDTTTLNMFRSCISAGVPTSIPLRFSITAMPLTRVFI
jgi:hypothetical protein